MHDDNRRSRRPRAPYGASSSARTAGGWRARGPRGARVAGRGDQRPAERPGAGRLPGTAAADGGGGPGLANLLQP
jgi:hypothetical protein